MLACAGSYLLAQQALAAHITDLKYTTGIGSAVDSYSYLVLCGIRVNCEAGCSTAADVIHSSRFLQGVQCGIGCHRRIVIEIDRCTVGELGTYGKASLWLDAVSKEAGTAFRTARLGRQHDVVEGILQHAGIAH